MSNLELFQSSEFGQVRTALSDGKVMFAATDVAKCLGYANPQKAIRNHCKSAGVNEMDTPTNGGMQKVIPFARLIRVESLSCSNGFRVLNFEHAPYVHPQNGQTYKMYTMTKDS